MENLNNLPPFYVGQKVVYITGISMPKNSVHVVSDVYKKGCGCCIIGINGDKIIFRKPKTGLIECSSCRKGYKSDKIFDSKGWNSGSFRPLQQQNFPLMKLSEIKIKELEHSLPILVGEN
jgi:hypothetical protein